MTDALLPVPAVPVAALLELRGVAKVYPGIVPVTALRDCSLTIDPGEYVSIMGPSGAGKSTLLSILGLLDVPTAGVYQFDGHDVASLPDPVLTALRARSVGFVFQAFHLLPYRTAVDNVALAMLYSAVPARERRQRAEQALASVGLTPRQHALPGQLSGGERQRVAIARAIVGRPRLLLCDEPTGNLDSATSAGVLELLEELNNSGLTLIVITHDPGIAERARRRLTVRDGLLSESASSPTSTRPAA